jgi:hypothetical protein
VRGLKSFFNNGITALYNLEISSFDGELQAFVDNSNTKEAYRVLSKRALVSVSADRT